MSFISEKHSIFIEKEKHKFYAMAGFFLLPYVFLQITKRIIYQYKVLT